MRNIVMAHLGEGTVARDSRIQTRRTVQKLAHDADISVKLELLHNADSLVILLSSEFAGVNGELPNMDMITSSTHHFEAQQVDVALDGLIDDLPEENLAFPHARALAISAVSQLRAPDVVRGAMIDYFERLLGMLSFMGSVAIGPSGPHAHFLQHSVDAITIRGHGQNQPMETCSELPISTTAAILSITRGISNLEEELHHSFFAYAMLSTKAFVSIGDESLTPSTQIQDRTQSDLGD